MPTHVFCSDAQRRQEVANSPGALNGIDHLEVLDRLYVELLGSELAEPLRQRTLLVQFLKPLSTEPADVLTQENIHITGGVRVTDIQIEWAAAATQAETLLTSGRILAEERDYLLSHPRVDRILVVRVDRRGDFSTYRLSLVASPEQPSQPPANVDAVLSKVDFSFKVECPSDFDCRVESICPPANEAQPAIDYLARDYSSFRRLMLDRLSVIMSDWQERNPADLGITLVELLAYAGDRLSYFQDAVGAEAYLGTARRRVSVRRHARLLDYRMHDGCNARAWVALEVGSESDGALLRRHGAGSGARPCFLTRIPGGPVLPAAEFERLWRVHQPQVFELLNDVALYEAHNEIDFYTWRNYECCLPRGATAATLLDHESQRLRLRAGDVLILEERLDPGTGQTVDADPGQRHAVRLTRVVPEADQDEQGRRTAAPLQTDPLTQAPIVQIEWADADALPFPLCLSTRIEGQLVERVGVARGNVVFVDHGRSLSGEQLVQVPTTSSSKPYRPKLSEPDVTRCVMMGDFHTSSAAASELVKQDPREALPAVELVDSSAERWTPRRDLLDSGRFDPHFVLEMEAGMVSHLRFARAGDQTGKTPAPGSRLTAHYRVGNGSAGNVGAEAIAHLVVDDAPLFRGLLRVRNPLPATGGTDPEAAERVRLDAPQAFRVQQRAVTEQDYEDMALRHPEVQTAVATRRWTGSWHTMFLTVDRRGGSPVDAGFRAELKAFLEQYRLVGHDLEVDAPRFVPLDIVMTVCVASDAFASHVRQALRATFSNRDLPDGRRGFFHPDNFTFGQPVYLSRVMAAAMDVPGVQWVDLTDRGDGPNRFRRFGERSREEFDEGRIAMGRLEIPQLDNDPSRPENGKIEFLMEGGA